MTKYFETIKCEDFEIFNLNYHEKRISNTIGLNLNLQDYIYPPNNKFLRCKLIYDESGILEVNFFPYEKKEVNSFKLLFNDEIKYEKKYLNREEIDKLYTLKDKENEIIIIKNGLLTDTSIANIAILIEGIWRTPKKPLLYGTTRKRYLDEKKIFEADISVEMLKKANKIALMNAMIDFYVIESYSLSL